MWEANIQVYSDLLTSKNGYLGTMRGASDPQHVKLYYSHHDFLVPHWVPEFPKLHGRYSLGGFKLSLETIFKLQYGLDIEYELTGKPSKVAFDYASNISIVLSLCRIAT